MPLPLVVGTTLLDRYTVIELVSSGDGANVYRVAEMRPCPACGVENEGNRAQCGYCGSELPAPRVLALVERNSPTHGAIVPTSFELDGMTYAFARDAATIDEEHATTLRLANAFLSDPGITRATRGEPNEDSVLAFEATGQFEGGRSTKGLYIVADGVGGAAAGEVASEMAVKTIAQDLTAFLFAPPNGRVESRAVELASALQAAIVRANHQIVEYGHTHHIALGTTVVLALVLDGRAYIANVGDSRAYLWRDDSLRQITRDHSFVGELVRKGEITAEQARIHPQRNLILRSLGDPSGVQPDVYPEEADGIELQDGDILLLCTDGLWEMVSDKELAMILGQNGELEEMCKQLVLFANAAGGADNITALALGACTS